MRSPRFAFVALLLALALTAGPAAAAQRLACDNPRFLVDGEPIHPGNGSLDLLELDGRWLTATSLGSGKLRVGALGEGTLVRARFGRPKRVAGAARLAQSQSSGLTTLALTATTEITPPYGINYPRQYDGDRPFQLRAWVSPDCSTLSGTVRGGPARIDREFVAHAWTPPDDAACPTDWFPVCGDDGVTYSNACHAVQAGAGIAYEGECSAVCGTIVGLACEDGEFCEMPDDTCSSADLGGTCVAIPQVCTQEYDPVCGCDGVTYPNHCERQRALVNQAHDGACAQ